MTEGSQLIRGLEGVVAVETRLCDLDGKNGRLAYCGYDIDELARLASFEEVCHLLWHGELPKPGDRDRLTVELIAARSIPAELVQAFALMPRDTDPNRVLQAAMAILGMHDPDANDNSHAANRRKAARLTSQMATAICAHHRVRSVGGKLALKEDSAPFQRALERHPIAVGEGFSLPDLALGLVEERPDSGGPCRRSGEFGRVEIEVEAQDHRSVEPQLRQPAQQVAVGSGHLHGLTSFTDSMYCGVPYPRLRLSRSR